METSFFDVAYNIIRELFSAVGALIGVLFDGLVFLFDNISGFGVSLVVVSFVVSLLLFSISNELIEKTKIELSDFKFRYIIDIPIVLVSYIIICSPFITIPACLFFLYDLNEKNALSVDKVFVFGSFILFTIVIYRATYVSPVRCFSYSPYSSNSSSSNSSSSRSSSSRSSSSRSSSSYFGYEKNYRRKGCAQACSSCQTRYESGARSVYKCTRCCKHYCNCCGSDSCPYCGERGIDWQKQVLPSFCIDCGEYVMVTSSHRMGDIYKTNCPRCNLIYEHPVI